uniref:Reverse transcriptase domain-containing protein n=1 Tax=Trichuris muris TaxID=70415 RepID=A0A5S6Q606_TRIMR
MLSGERMRCVGTGTVNLRLERGNEATVETIVTSEKPMGFEFIIGMTGIVALGGVEINDQGLPRFCLGVQAACGEADTGCYIDEKDFTVAYDPKSHTWTAAWKWADNKAPETLWNTIEEYSPTAEARAEYKRELDLWVRNGWLVPYDEKKLGPARALIPLMVVTQRSKGTTVRPVMDIRQLNEYIDIFTANSDVCAHKLREWRRQGMNVSILDLRKAYLQIHVDQTLWPYQTVIVKDRRYALTRGEEEEDQTWTRDYRQSSAFICRCRVHKEADASHKCLQRSRHVLNSSGYC